jgi:hypothetical protein
VEFSVLVADVEELELGPPEEVAVENARRKAAAVAAERPELPVLGADTIVCAGERIYGKPADQEAARSTLRALSGRRHAVIGGRLPECGRAAGRDADRAGAVADRRLSSAAIARRPCARIRLRHRRGTLPMRRAHN